MVCSASCLETELARKALEIEMREAAEVEEEEEDDDEAISRAMTMNGDDGESGSVLLINFGS